MSFFFLFCFFQAPLFAGDKIIGNFKQQHTEPSDGAGEGNARNAEPGCQNEGADRPDRGLDKGSQHGSIHLSHAPEKALHTVGHGREQIEYSHAAKVFTSQPDNFLRTVTGDKHADNGRPQQHRY